MESNLDILNTEFAQMSEQFPAAQLPPQCFTMMSGQYEEYDPRVMLKVSFPVVESFLNPTGSMQGGFIAAAFDNVIGPLSYLSSRQTCVSLDMHTNFIRPIMAGDRLVITARVVIRGRETVNIAAEAVNSKGKLIATCTSHLIVKR